jgi:predicted nucleic acid-binding protein
MNAKPFLDTNILIYAFARNDHRGLAAEAIVAAGGVISVQVLNEFVNVCRRKLNLEWSGIDEARQVLKNLLDPPVPLTLEVHESAVVLSRDHGLAFYDSLIVAAAMSAKCDTLYTEDMQDGRKVGPLTILNPFR